MRGRRACTLIGIALAALGAVPTTAGAAKLVAVQTPSTNVDPKDVSFNGPVRQLRANVLLPDGFDRAKRYPVLYLLHGTGGTYEDWSKPELGDIADTARGLDAIVVMPEAASGYYTNWFNDGARGRPGWERFYLDELVPQIERQFPIRAGRRWHAIAGLSMGGLGTTYVASQLPGYFGAAAPFSGFVSTQRPVAAGALEAAGIPYRRIFGPIDGFYAAGHNPARLAPNLAHSRLFVATGNGVPEPGVPTNPGALTAGVVIEQEVRQQADDFVAAARAAGADVTFRPETGVHDWPYRRRHLREAIAWGLFEPVPEAPSSWTYETVGSRGDAWGLTYRFARPPERVETFSRAGKRLRGQGAGTVTVANAAGCGFTAALPFDRAVPPGICGRLRVRVAPGRLRAHRVTRVRVRVTRRVGARSYAVPGARVRIGGAKARTDRRGLARLRVRPSGRAGRRVVAARVAGLRRATARVRVVR